MCWGQHLVLWGLWQALGQLHCQDLEQARQDHKRVWLQHLGLRWALCLLGLWVWEARGWDCHRRVRGVEVGQQQQQGCLLQLGEHLPAQVRGRRLAG